MVVPLGKDEALPESQVEIADSCADGETCALLKQNAWRMQFVPFNCLSKSRSGEAEVLVKLGLNA